VGVLAAVFSPFAAAGANDRAGVPARKARRVWNEIGAGAVATRARVIPPKADNVTRRGAIRWVSSVNMAGCSSEVVQRNRKGLDVIGSWPLLMFELLWLLFVTVDRQPHPQPPGNGYKYIEKKTACG
jgi:hypothetical protein